ncbi:hypothetical protein Sinac_4528 [Singulisphaera acidiphila DSM 18658]|uniref:Uncharacterized protein n=1 Tax=Singulisphaera acidiphila (strain ATCC BAA-1392 / DSM 18658 / VKM B-2454 / MOB10) TaxID=886293 RepID=L0DIM8_SINAD|nr:hypothetical protein Sinac_4528 [Singulisphaera acidiphila DSM 18658]
MRRPWLRITTRRLMCAIAVVAIVLGWLVTRPYPTMGFWSAACYVVWSDGSVTLENGPNTLNFRGNNWLVIVDWPDGRTRYYLALR